MCGNLLNLNYVEKSNNSNTTLDAALMFHFYQRMVDSFFLALGTVLIMSVVISTLVLYHLRKRIELTIVLIIEGSRYENTYNLLELSQKITFS